MAASSNHIASADDILLGASSSNDSDWRLAAGGSTPDFVVQEICGCCGKPGHECGCDCDMAKRTSFYTVNPNGADFKLVLGIVPNN